MAGANAYSATRSWLPLQGFCSRVEKLGSPLPLRCLQTEQQEGDGTAGQGWRGAGLGGRKVVWMDRGICGGSAGQREAVLTLTTRGQHKNRSCLGPAFHILGLSVQILWSILEQPGSQFLFLQSGSVGHHNFLGP